VIRHGRQAFFFEAALTNCGILIVDCKTENWVWLCKCTKSVSTSTFLFSDSSVLKL
jgi:hypothetical protein